MNIDKNITEEQIANNIFLCFNDNGRTNFNEATNIAGFSEEVVKKFEISSKLTKAQYLLENDWKYIDTDDTLKNSYKLTPLGKEVKKAGGHFAYLDKLKAKELAELKRQERKDKADELDLQIKSWQVKTKWFPYFVSFIALCVSIASYFKPEKKQIDLQPMQGQIQQLKDHVKSLDSLLPSDTLLKKHK